MGKCKSEGLIDEKFKFQYEKMMDEDWGCRIDKMSKWESVKERGLIDEKYKYQEEKMWGWE